MSKFTFSSPTLKSIRRDSFKFKRAYIETMQDLFDNDQDRYTFLLELIERGLNGTLENHTRPGLLGTWANDDK